MHQLYLSSIQKILIISKFHKDFYSWISRYYLKDLEEIQDFANDWMWSYINKRPNMALGGFTLKQRLAMTT